MFLGFLKKRPSTPPVTSATERYTAVFYTGNASAGEMSVVKSEAESEADLGYREKGDFRGGVKLYRVVAVQ